MPYLPTVLATAAVGLVTYVGFTAVELVGLVTDEPPSSAPAATAPVSAPQPSAKATPEPAARPAKAARPAPKPRPAKQIVRKAPAPVRRAVTHQPARRDRARADLQLARMLRAVRTPAWLGGASWVKPVAGYHLTARYGETSYLWASRHTGLDFAAPVGTPVRAVSSGVVTFAGPDGAYGNKIVVTLPDGTETWYAHLSRIDVRVGTAVATGAPIGAVGATGNVTGPHLHLEVRPGGGDPVDPYAALKEHGVRA